MAIFTIGDPHLSLGSSKPMEIFAGWGNYVSRLEQCWRNLVSEQDTVVVAGDISWAMTLEEAQQDFAFLHSLPGQKIFLKGNHDYWWSTMKKMNAFVSEQGFSSIRFLFNNAYIVEGIGICGTRSWLYDEAEPENDKVFARELGRLRASLAALDRSKCEETVVFLHYPPIYREFVVEEVIALLRQYGVRRCYYGHLHGQSIPHALNGEYEGIQFRLISADHLQFAPYKIH